MAAVHQDRAQAAAERKTAQAAATARYGAVRVGAQHKRNLHLKGAATAVRKQELAPPLAAAAVAAHGEPARDKLARRQANLQQVKLAATAAQEQEQLHVIPIQAAGQQVAGERAAAQGSVLLAQHNLAGLVAHKPAHQAALGAAAAGKIAQRQANPRQVKLAVIAI